MGFLWDLMQQSQISAQEQRNASLEGRVTALEIELRRTREILHALIERLERKIGEDLNEDGRVG